MIDDPLGHRLVRDVAVAGRALDAGTVTHAPASALLMCAVPVAWSTATAIPAPTAAAAATTTAAPAGRRVVALTTAPRAFAARAPGSDAAVVGWRWVEGIPAKVYGVAYDPDGLLRPGRDLTVTTGNGYSFSYAVSNTNRVRCVR